MTQQTHQSVIDLPGEQWRDIPNTQGYYQASTCGRIKRTVNKGCRHEHLLHPRYDKDGYLKITLSVDGDATTYQVHRLIATTFIPNPDHLPQVNHRDERKDNNEIQNLEWCSANYNVNYGDRTAKCYKAVKCVETGIIYESQKAAAAAAGVSQSAISHACRGVSHTASGYHWEFAQEV